MNFGCGSVFVVKPPAYRGGRGIVVALGRWRRGIHIEARGRGRSAAVRLAKLVVEEALKRGHPHSKAWLWLALRRS